MANTSILNFDNSDYSAGFVSNTADIALWYGAEKKENARVIPMSVISELTVRESIFNGLPTIRIVLVDQGSYMNIRGFEHGKLLYVKMTPVIDLASWGQEWAEKIPTPYLESKFRIESIEYIGNDSSNDYRTIIHGVYAAENYLNEICQWPPDNFAETAFIKNLGVDLAPVKTGGYNSVELITKVAQNAGLQPSIELSNSTTPDDRMYWLNKNLTHQEFIKFIVDHAWLGEDDCPLFYVNRDGQGVYTSLKTFKDNAAIANYKRALTVEKNNDNTYCRKFMYAYLKNAGYVQNEGGYGVQSNVYNPYAAAVINSIPQIEGINNPAASSLPIREKLGQTGISDEHDRAGVFHSKNIYIGKMSNKSTATANCIRYATNDMYFLDTHQYYDYAPLHNLACRKAFFNIFLYLAIDCGGQMLDDMKSTQRVKLGDKINVDLTTIDNKTSIQNGEFIVSGIIHTWKFGGAYGQTLCCTSDGINGVELKNNSIK